MTCLLQDFSSQYGSDQSYSYTASNLVGTPSMFPAYGDSPYTFAQREFSTAFKEVNLTTPFKLLANNKEP